MGVDLLRSLFTALKSVGCCVVEKFLLGNFLKSSDLNAEEDDHTISYTSSKKFYYSRQCTTANNGT